MKYLILTALILIPWQVKADEPQPISTFDGVLMGQPIRYIARPPTDGIWMIWGGYTEVDTLYYYLAKIDTIERYEGPICKVKRDLDTLSWHGGYTADTTCVDTVITNAIDEYWRPKRALKVILSKGTILYERGLTDWQVALKQRELAEATQDDLMVRVGKHSVRARWIAAIIHTTDRELDYGEAP